jgi:hypothetical protein
LPVSRREALLVPATLLAATTAVAQPTGFRFALIGDMGYSEANFAVPHERQYANVLAELNAADLAFVIHDGDIGAGSETCSDTGLQIRLRQFQASAHPLIYTPGDNEWTDCRSIADPLARLASIRELFFDSDRSLGQRTLPLTRQSDVDRTYWAFAENALWHFGDVTFATLHVVGSNNNRGQPEHDLRDDADVAWMARAFAEATARSSRGLMLVMHANMFNGRNEGITNALHDGLIEGVLEFGRPVVMVHGDTHQFIIDKPLRGWNGHPLEMFTRVQTFGTPDHHWVEAIVDPADPMVFNFRQRIVRANLYDHPR